MLRGLAGMLARKPNLGDRRHVTSILPMRYFEAGRGRVIPGSPYTQLIYWVEYVSVLLAVAVGQHTAGCLCIEATIGESRISPAHLLEMSFIVEFKATLRSL